MLTRSISQVFRKINKNLPTLTLLELQYVSPKLLNAKDLDLAVPGTACPFRSVTAHGGRADNSPHI